MDSPPRSPPGSYQPRPRKTSSPGPSTARQWLDDSEDEELPELEDSLLTSEAVELRSMSASSSRSGETRTRKSGGTPRSRRAPSTPRRRVISRPTHPSSPRRTPTRPRSHPQEARLPINTPPSPTLVETLHLVLTPFQLLFAPLQLILSPFLVHLVNVLLISVLFFGFLYFGLPKLLLSWGIRKIFRIISGSWISSFSLDTGTATMISQAALLPLRTLAIPTCALLNIGCPSSLLSTGGSGNSTHSIESEGYLAKPFWEWSIFQSSEESILSPPSKVNVGQVARALTGEVRGAKDIFDSVRMLGEGGVAGGLDYVRIWEFGMTILTGSNLEEKSYIGKEVINLGDLTRTLSDEVIVINSKTVSAFSWLQWEFSRLVQLLERSPLSPRDQDKLVSALHSLLVRLSATLDDLHKITESSVPLAAQASDQGKNLLLHLGTIRSSLEREKSRSPIWKRAYDRSAHLIVGGEPSRSELIDRDLRISRDTIENLHGLHERLEDTRRKVKTFMGQVDGFHAGIMGMHLGSGDDDGALGPEEEVRILAGVVGELGEAVGAAKIKPRYSSDIGKDNYDESEQGKVLGVEA